MALVADFGLEIGTLTLSAKLSVGGEVVAILGPNGAGKTTLLRALAGLVPIDSGQIAVGDQILDDPQAGVFVPPNHRPISLVFQDYLLFPFLSARENVAFGLRSRKMPKHEAHRQANEWLSRFGLADQTNARPGELSGGQAQRVALARALAIEPQVLLLDEPLAALDAGARVDIRNELRTRLTQTTGARLIVTHDAADAAALCDRVVILEGGRIVQEGTFEEISVHPRSRYVADLVGLNFYKGNADKGMVTVSETGASLFVAEADLSGPVLIVIDPKAVMLQTESLSTEEGRVSNSARNRWRGRVVSLDALGDRVRVKAHGKIPLVAEVTPESVRSLRLAIGRDVIVLVKATAIKASRA